MQVKQHKIKARKTTGPKHAKRRVAKRTMVTKARRVIGVSKMKTPTSSPIITPTIAPTFKAKKNKIAPFAFTQRLFASMPPSGQLLNLPALSPTMETGGLANWYVKIGQLIKPGDLIADVQTDKAVVGFESQDEYYLAAILVEAGTQDLPVQCPLGITVDDEADIAAAQAYAQVLKSGGAPTQTTTPAQKEKQEEPAPVAVAPTTRNRKAIDVPPKPASAAKMELPALSPTMEKGKVVKWYAKEGDLIKPGDLIADIATDKAVVGFESQDEYYLAKILVQADAEVDVNQLIAVTAEDEAELDASKQWAEAIVAAEAGLADDAPADIDATPTAPVTTTTQQPTSSNGASGKYKHKPLLPATAILLENLNVDPSSVEPTGPLGHLTKGDILKAVENGTAVYNTTTQKSHATKVATPTVETKVEKKATPSAAQPVPNSQMSGRRRRARQYNDIQLTPTTSQANKDLANNKVPQHYSQVTINVNKIHSFINTYAKDTDLNAALVSVIAKSINNNVKTVNKDLVIENDFLVVNKATGSKFLLSRHVATQMSTAFKHAQANADISETSSLFNVQLYTNLPAGTVSAYERLQPGSLMNVVVGAPFNTVQMTNPETGHVQVDKNVVVAITSDNNVVDEMTAAGILNSVKKFANDPITMLL